MEAYPKIVWDSSTKLKHKNVFEEYEQSKSYQDIVRSLS